MGMQVFLDGERLEGDSASIASALSAGSARARARGRIIIEAKADGEALTDGQLQGDIGGGAIRELRLLSADPRNLVKVTLSDGAEALRALVDEQRRVATLVHQDQGQEAIPGLQGVFQTWQTVRDLVDRSGAVLEADFGPLTLAGLPPGETVAGASARLLAHLRAVKHALGRQDWSALADLLEFELVDEARAWERILNALAKHVGGMPPAVHA
jgi:hypothetical protein